MEKIIQRSATLVNSIRLFAYAKWQLASFRIADNVSELFADLAGLLLFWLFIFAFSLFVGLAIAILIGNWLHSAWMGYAIVGILFLVKGFVLWKIRDRLFRYPVLNRILKSLDQAYGEDKK